MAQDEGDDFIGEEAAEAEAAQGEVREAIAAANRVNREAEDINPEELERYSDSLRIFSCGCASQWEAQGWNGVTVEQVGDTNGQTLKMEGIS